MLATGAPPKPEANAETPTVLAAAPPPKTKANTRTPETAAADGPKKKKQRRPTGILRRWTGEEDVLLADLVHKNDALPLTKNMFEAFAATLNEWASCNAMPGSARSGYAVEQHWKLYLAPGAPKANGKSKVPAKAGESKVATQESGKSKVPPPSTAGESKGAAQEDEKEEQPCSVHPVVEGGAAGNNKPVTGTFMHYCNHIDDLPRAESMGALRDGNKDTGHGDDDWHFLFTCPSCNVDLSAVVPVITGGGVSGEIYGDGHVFEPTKRGSCQMPCLHIEKCRGHPNHVCMGGVSLPNEEVPFCCGPAHGVAGTLQCSNLRASAHRFTRPFTAVAWVARLYHARTSHPLRRVPSPLRGASHVRGDAVRFRQESAGHRGPEGETV